MSLRTESRKLSGWSAAIWCLAIIAYINNSGKVLNKVPVVKRCINYLRAFKKQTRYGLGFFCNFRRHSSFNG